MNWHVLIERLPAEWFHLITILADSLTAYPHQRMEMWWRLSGKQLRWTEVLGFLAQLEPLSKDGQLVYEPFFYHLPDNLQKHILQFIYQHCDDIGSTILKQFLESLCENNCTKVDWIELYLNLLKSRAICRRKTRDDEPATEMQRTETKCDTFRTSLTTEFQFSEGNSVQFLTLCERLRVASNCVSAPNVGILSSSRSDETGKDRLMMSPSASGTIQENDVIGECVLEECMELEATEISLKKSLAVNDLAEMESVVISDQEMPDCNVGYDIQNAVLRLRESWFREQTVDPEVVIMLKNLSPQQLQSVLEQMEALNLPDSSILLACQTVVECASQQITYHDVLLFANVFLLPQILKLESGASRLFAAAVVSFVKAFPLHSIEGIFQPLLASASSLGIPQFELAIKVVKEAFSNQHQRKLLHVLLETGDKTWSDLMMLVVQSIIETKVELPSDDLKHLLISLERNSPLNSSNQKFGKLLFSFAQAYGHMLTAPQLQQLNQVTDSHKTFLTKLIKSTLSKLSTDA